MKLKVLIIIAVCVFIVGAGVFVGIAIYNNIPETVTINAVVGVFDDVFEREEIAPLVSTVQKGSVQVSMNKLSVDGKSSDIKVDGKIYFSKKAIMVDELLVYLDDMRISGNAYVSEDMIYVNETEILDKSIGIVKGELADDFSHSIFACGSGSDYAIAEKEDYEKILEILKCYDSVDIDAFSKDAKKLIALYIKELWKIFCEHAEFTSKTDEIMLANEKRSARVITVTVDSKALSGIIEDAYEFLKNDENMREFIEKYEKDLYVIAKMLLNFDHDSFAGFYEETLKSIENDVKDICTKAEKNDTHVEFEIVTPKLSSKLLKFTMTVDKEDIFVIDFGKSGIKESDKISIEVYDEKLVYEVAEDSSDAFKIGISLNDEEFANFRWDKTEVKYSLSVADKFDAKGSLSKNNEKIIFTVDELLTYKESWLFHKIITTTYTSDAKVVICEKDEMPKPLGNFERISDITNEDVKRIVKSIIGILF